MLRSGRTSTRVSPGRCDAVPLVLACFIGLFHQSETLGKAVSLCNSSKLIHAALYVRI